MCNAQDLHRIHSAACLLCFLLCVLLNVHVHASASGSHATHRANQSRRHLELVMAQFGNASSNTSANTSMSLVGLQNLMRRIGLDNKPVVDEHHEHEHEHGHEHEHEHEDEKTKGGDAAGNSTAVGAEATCPSARQMIAWYHTDWQLDLTEAEFQDLCPTLVYLLASGACAKPREATKSSPVGVTRQYWNFRDPHVLKVWGASLLAVAITSFGGVATIFLIRPLMRTRFYSLLVQFLIALAVGSLSGDAFLHLLPHALFPHDEDSSHEHKEGGGPDSHGGSRSHMQTLNRCLTALIGIYCFFVIERVTVLCQNRRSRQRRHKVRGGGATGTDAGGRNNNNNNGEEEDEGRRAQASSSNVGEKLCNPFHRSYANLTGASQDPSCSLRVNDTGAVEFHDTSGGGGGAGTNGNCLRRMSCNQQLQQQRQQQQQQQQQSVCDRSELACMSQQQQPQLPANSNSNSDSGGCSRAPIVVRFGGDNCDVNDGGTATNGVKSPREIDADVDEDDEDEADIDEEEKLEKNNKKKAARHSHSHSHSHHGHSHSHTTVRALAWTVIIGDGLHNFCDGMALGAAFAADLGSGLSTAVAVFCHELPHELGDFAVLLQAGMSVRMALLANLVSSVVCLLGMVAGLLLVQKATSWIFMGTAGMFLYIALVDMMPELATEKSSRGPGPCAVFLWQNIGFILGAGIMFLISLYEHKIIQL